MGSARKAAAPWLLIFTNPVVVAFMFAKFACKLSTDAQAMQIPMYLKNVFNVSKELVGCHNLARRLREKMHQSILTSIPI